MNFALSEDQELLRETVQGFVERACPPARVREIFDGDTGHDPALWKGLVEMGIAGLLVSTRQGGAGLGLLELALVAEALGEGAMPGPFLGHSLATLALVAGGSEAQQQRWLPALASGETLATVAWGETDGGWEPEAWTPTLEDGRLHGAKDFVPGGRLADLVVVGVSGGRLALVETKSGVEIEAVDSQDRTRPLDRLVMESVPCELLEKQVAGRLRDAALVLLAADAFGAGTKLVQMSVAYAMSREQFGQPIARFQSVKHQLANMALEVDPTRGLWWFAAYAYDHLPDESERAAAIAKSHITDRVLQVARDAVEVHGGIGFTWECDVQIWFKRALFDRLFLGTPDQHRERIARLGGW